MITILILAFTSFSLYLSWKDHKTTHVTLLDLLVLAGLGTLIGVQTPFHQTSLVEHLIGAGLALVVTLAVRWFGQAWTQREAFGEADVWVATIGGFVIGMQWLPVWLGASTAIGLVFYVFLSREDEDGQKILPFLPTMFITLLTITWARWWSLLPSTWF